MMERLTFDGLFCDIAICQEVPCKYPDVGCSQRQVWERLKSYEDTGLNPEDVAELLQERDKMIEILKEAGGCGTCANHTCQESGPLFWVCDECDSPDDCSCYTCRNESNWKWRGVEEKRA